MKELEKSGGIFDVEKLNWVNAHYIKQYQTEKIAELSMPFMVAEGLMTEEEMKSNWNWYVLLIETVKESLSNLSEVPEKVRFLFGDLNITEEEAKAELSGEQVPDLIKGI